MSLDAITIQALVEELRPQLMGLHVDKVQQPMRHQVILVMHGKRLLLDAGANAPRLQLTEQTLDNPAEPPMFCMLLRKHLAGARLVGLEQPPLERLVRLKFEITDSFGRTGTRELVLEAMGRRSNLIFLDGEGRILECLRRVDADLSAARQILPGLYYDLPSSHGRPCFTGETAESFAARFALADPAQSADVFLRETYFGLSPLLAREVTFRACGRTDIRLEELGGEGAARLWTPLLQLQNDVNENHFTPLFLRRNGDPMELCCVPVLQYGAAVESVRCESFSAMLDTFYETRERQERIRQRGSDLLKTATTARDRLVRKLALQEKDYQETQNREKLRICGDLITSNLYRMERGQGRLVCENFYEEGCPTVTIPLDALLTPQQNAAKYYKRYVKARTAEKYLSEQMELARRDRDYLESVLEEIAEAETEQDFLEIRNELRESGFLRRQGAKKKESRHTVKPREFWTTTGFRVLVGRNNRQNDRLTLKDADRRDLWFHTQKIHGAHVILCREGREADEQTLTETAMLAAYYSQARQSSRVPVDCAPVKQVKKPVGARPGMVVYRAERTFYVTPDAGLTERLQKKRTDVRQ